MIRKLERIMGHGKTRLLLATAAVLVVAQFGAAMALAGNAVTSVQQGSYVTNQVLVTLRDGRTAADLAGFNAQYGSHVVRRLAASNIYVLELPEGRDPVSLVGVNSTGVMAKYAAVRGIQLNRVYRLLATPNDPFFTSYYDTAGLRGQWPYQPDPVDPAIKHIHAPEAWDLEKGSSDVVVAVIDSGIRTQDRLNEEGVLVARPHPDLVDRLIRDPALVVVGEGGSLGAIPPDVAMGDFDPGPDTIVNPSVAAHGTECAGIIAAQGDNSMGITGLCWNGVRILPVKVATDEGVITDAALYEAMEYVIRYRDTELTSTGQPLRVNVVNLSLGGPAMPSQIMVDQYRRAVASGIVVVAAAGNDWELGLIPPGYPAALDDVICVGSTDYKDVISSYSQRGRAMDIVAPGEDVVSTSYSASLSTVDPNEGGDTGGDTGGGDEPPITPPGSVSSGPTIQAATALPDDRGNYIAEFISGTSFAAPVISGAAALLISHGVPASDVKDILYSTATPLGYGRPNDTYGWGLLNMRRALEKASIDVQIKSPAKSSIVTNARPQFRIEFRHALKSSIQVWLDKGTASEALLIGNTTGGIPNWDPYYTVLDSTAGKSYLQFDYPVAPGNHTITAVAQTDMELSETLSAQDSVNFTVRADVLIPGWHMFSVPYTLDSSVAPESVIGYVSQLWRYAYADGLTGTYAAYSASGSADNEATFRPASVLGMNLVHPLDGTVATSPAGLGYWLRVRSPGLGLPSLDPESASELAKGPYEIGLYNGWNMVGCPFTTSAPWASAVFDFNGLRYSALEAVQMGLVANYIYSYDPLRQVYVTAPISSAVMQPWQAQWVRVKVNAPQTGQVFNSTFRSGFDSVSATNCTGYVGDNWSAFSVSGNAYFNVGSSGVSDSSSQKVMPYGVNPGYFNAGIYQQVEVVPGHRYAFSVWTKRVKNCTGVLGACRWPTGEGTQVGIDPTGGVDPMADSVVWSSTEGLVGDWIQQVAYAQAESWQMTVFVRTVANAPGTDKAVYVDSAKISDGHDITLIVNP